MNKKETEGGNQVSQEAKDAANKPRKGRTQRVNENEGEWAKRHRAFNEKILDEIVGNAQFRETLLADPQSALRSAGFENELRELDQHDAFLVKGCDSSCLGTCQASCKSFTCFFTASC
ncbi:MAG: hypothetical protein M3Y27_14125 [Acidobacteriota bacterium]|nr:hypothetical protein [Acidobacteriota bacterium]